MKEVFRIADRTICIDAIYDTVYQLCAEYQINGSDITADSSPSVDFTIQTSPADIEYERVRSVQEKALEGQLAYHPKDAYLETLAVYRKIAEKMPDFDTVLMHGSCVAVDGAGYLFTAKSGTGKSTHTKLWRALLGDRAVMVNDDKPLIRITDDGAVVYGTPWNGKHRLGTNIAVPLKAVCILKRAEENTIHPISVSNAYPMLIQQIYRPADTAAMTKTLTLIDKLAQNVSLWQLGCNISLEAAQLAYQAMHA